jgi:N-acetylglucosamine kinase-like BadF-type ATPase
MHLTLAPSLLLGVDAGGSKTLALVADSTGYVLGRGLAGSANYQSVGFPVASVELSRAITRALADAGLTQESVVAAVLGLAGVDRPEDKALYLQWAAGFLPAATVQIVNDAALVLAAGTPAGWGLALICGTGAIAVGRTPDGRTTRAGGWGPLLGDEGSGYALGRAALQAVMRAYDGRASRTVLTTGILSAWGLPSPDALVRRVYQEAVGPAEIAALAPVVEAAAAEGDETALAITRTAGEELALALWAVARQLELSAPVPCALAGGVIIRERMIRDALLRAAAASGLALEPVNLVAEPALGAIRLARGLHEGPDPAIMLSEDC